MKSFNSNHKHTFHKNKNFYKNGIGIKYQLGN